MEWFAAMLLILPFMRGRAKVRTWGALFLASVAAWVFPSIAAHIAIDLLAGALVLKRPRGLAQKIIGFGFVAMLIFSSGYVMSQQANPWTLYYAMLGIGWAQWAVLLSWGLYDFARNRSGRLGPAGRVHAPDVGRVRP